MCSAKKPALVSVEIPIGRRGASDSAAVMCMRGRSVAGVAAGRLCSKIRLPDRVEQMMQLTLIAKDPFFPAAEVSAEITVSKSTITSSERERDKHMQFLRDANDSQPDLE